MPADIGSDDFERLLPRVAALIAEETGLPLERAEALAVPLMCTAELDDENRVILRDPDTGQEVARVSARVLEPLN